MTKRTSRREKGITLIALIVTIIVLLILAGVTINLAVNNQGIFNKAKTATRAYKNASENEQMGLDEADKEIESYLPGVRYKDAKGETKTLTKSTAVGTKIGTTANISGKDGVTGVSLDWYLFDVSDNGKTAYLVSTPTYWVPDTEKEVSGAYPPKLVSSADSNTGAIRQAIQTKASGKAYDSYTYEKDNLKYTPSDKTWNYFKSVNLLWSAKRENTAFASLNENEQAACYLADADIFAGIKDQVNNAEGNLKGKIQTLVGGASAEQWCKAYNKQSAASNSKITCAYQETNTPGYIYKVNGTAQNSGWYTNNKTIVGNDIYGAAYTYNRSNNSTYPFSSCYWWLASPSSYISISVCAVGGGNSDLYYDLSNYYRLRFSLLASVALDSFSNLTFTATPTTKTSGNVTVKVSTTVTGYTLQTSTDGSTWGTTNPLIFSQNGTAYARLWDGNNASAVATFNITNIDKTNYTISYNLNGGSASGNPTSYKVDSSTITINDPTRVAYKFLGWTGSNDLSSGLENYTSSSPYVAASRDHILGNEFNVTAGEKYRVFVRGTRTKGNLNLQGGIWYTAQTSGKGYDGYGGSFTEIETGLFYKEITIPTGKTKGKFYIQLDQDTSGGSTSWKLYDMHVIKVENPTIPKGSQGNKSFTANWKLSIDANTPVGTKIGTTANIDGQTLDWYLFDVSDDSKTAYLVSTPTYWVPDTTKAVNGAWVPKLVASPDSKTGAMNQAIQKKASATSGDYSYSYDSSKVTYTPSPNTLSYYKSVNSQWSDKRGSTAFASLNENEQSACYLADADIFAGIKDQVNKAEGNLKGKIQTLVGGASAEQWCKAYNKQSAAKDHKITCEYRATSVLGYIYKVNDKQSTVSNDDYWTGTNTIFGNDIYGAANNNGNKTNNPFYTGTGWWLASPSAYTSHDMCYVLGGASYLSFSANAFYNYRFSLFASVAL